MTNDKGNNINNIRIKTLLEIAIMLISVGMVWATLREKVGQNTRDIDRNNTAIQCVEKEMKEFREKTMIDVGAIKGDIREMKVIQGNMSSNVLDIKKSLEEHMTNN